MTEREGEQTEGDGPITPFDAAGYIFQMLGEMAIMSRGMQFDALATSLERARDVAAETLMQHRRQSEPE